MGVPVYGRDADDYLRRSAIGENDAVVAECDLSRYACALVTLNGTADHDDIASHAVIHKARAPDEVLHALHERAPRRIPLKGFSAPEDRLLPSPAALENHRVLANVGAPTMGA